MVRWSASPLRESGVRHVTAKTSLRRRMLGIVVGAAVGLFVDSALVVVLGAPIIYFVVFTFGLNVLAPIVIGIAWAINWASKLSREPSWQALVLLAATLWPAAVGTPFAIRIAQLHIAAWHDVPRYAHARNVSTTAELGESEDFGSRVRMKFITEDTPAEVIQFYRNELNRRGWKPGPPQFIERKMDGTPLWFMRRASFGGFGDSLLGIKNSLHIKCGPASNQRELRCEVIYGVYWDNRETG